jgi:hypothetical protein
LGQVSGEAEVVAATVAGWRGQRWRLLEILENGNEDAAKFLVTSRYVVATARHGGEQDPRS